MAATALGDRQVGFRSNWKKKPEAGSAVRTAERRPRETEAEEADAPASRVLAPHGSQSGTATRSARGSGVRDRGTRGATSFPALTSRPHSRSRLSPLFRQALRNDSVLPGVRSDCARSLPRSDLGRRVWRTARARRGRGRPGLRLRRGGSSRRACAVAGRGGKEGGGGTGGGC